jgi:mono/diheme cytochrome c family protein
VAVTRTSTVTATTTPAPATAEATPAETTTDEAGEDGEAGEDSEGAAAAGQEELISMGEAVYAEECASCHQNNGEGTSVYPALNGSAMLTAEDPTDAINIVLYGEGEMPAFEEILSTEEIAAVLSHERNAWDNNASVVTVEQVEEVSGN